MSLEQPVEYMRIAFESRQKFLPNRYEFRPDRKWHWLQKLAIWTLKKLDCNAFITEQQMFRTELIHKGNLEKQIFEQYVDMIEWYHHSQADRVLVGPKEFYELSAIPFDRPLSIDLHYGWAERDREPPWNTKHTRNDLKITVIPHMKGVLVLPKGWDK